MKLGRQRSGTRAGTNEWRNYWCFKEREMAKGSKGKYTSKQKRQAEHIAEGEGYEKRGTKKQTAKARAWATVNKSTKGGKKSG